MPKLTDAKVDYFLKDEKHASREYASYGFKGLSRDEARHARFFEAEKKRRAVRVRASRRARSHLRRVG